MTAERKDKWGFVSGKEPRRITDQVFFTVTLTDPAAMDRERVDHGLPPFEKHPKALVVPKPWFPAKGI
jgi:hypothetical protein